ncbi:MAG TPA: PIN domain-containing protein [Bacillota bacterium]|nr:PIN domain-containing protein [Bacillota bacterium]
MTADGPGRVAAVDTNVLLPILLGDPADDAEAAYALLRRTAARGQQLRVYLWSVAEMVFTLERRYKVDRASIAADVSSLLADPALAVEPEGLLLEALAVYGQYNVPFGDALIAMSMRTEGIGAIWSWDRDFERLPGLERRAPA